VLFGGVSRVIGVVLIIGGLVYGLVPGVRNNVNDEIGKIKGKVNSWIHPSRTEVLPTGVFASSQLPGHSAEFVKDGPTNTYWMARVPSVASRRLTLDFTFQNAFDLKNLAVWNGVGSAKTPDYSSTRRLQTIFLEFPDTTVKGCEVAVKDLPGEADKIDVSQCGANGVSRIRVTVLQYYGDIKLPDVATAKIQFYKKG
jgi:hypothetical protein